MSYDFFLAHAGPDTVMAERLYDLLVGETRVFLDSRSLVLGDDWDRALAEAQRHSRVTVVLVSARTDAAFYQREEIAAAIELARKDEAQHRVVPVYLAPVSTDMPYGLRLKHGLVMSDELPVQLVAARLLDLHRMMAAQAGGPAGEYVATPFPARGVARTELIEQLFDRDPVVSLPAIAGLTELGPSIVPEVVARICGLNSVNIIVIRTMLGRFPEESARLMADRVLDAARDWHGVTFVPDCLSPRQRPFCADFLARHLDDSEPDVVRKCIESLGFMAAETWGGRLLELLRSSDKYHDEKYSTYVIVARARMLVLLEADQIEQSWRLPSAFSDVEQLIAAASRRGWRSFEYSLLQEVLAKCQPRHADHLITSWLTADLVERRALAARTLGQMRLRRSLPYLVRLATSASEADQTAHEAAIAIANIGGPTAVTALDDLLTATRDDEERSEDLRWALSHCLADASDDGQFARLARDILESPPAEACFAYRAIGIRRDDRFTTELHRGIENADPTIRGQSALALARIGDGRAHDILVRAMAEAANSQERVLASLGLLLTDDAVPGDPDLLHLRTDLSQQSFRYKRLITDDIVQVLSASRHPQAAPIAEAWRSVYAAGQDY